MNCGPKTWNRVNVLRKTAGIGSLKVKSAAKPLAKSALCIEKSENDPGIIR